MWEEVQDEYGRTYFWNPENDKVTWNRAETAILKPKDKTNIKVETEVKEDVVKLKLVQSQPKDKIINRIWDQLTNKQNEFCELETIYKNNIIKKTILSTFYYIIEKNFKVWKHSVDFIILEEKLSLCIKLCRWKESKRYKESFTTSLKVLTDENKKVLKELVNTKMLLAQENYNSLLNK